MEDSSCNYLFLDADCFGHRWREPRYRQYTHRGPCPCLWRTWWRRPASRDISPSTRTQTQHKKRSRFLPLRKKCEDISTLIHANIFVCASLCIIALHDLKKNDFYTIVCKEKEDGLNIHCCMNTIIIRVT